MEEYKHKYNLPQLVLVAVLSSMIGGGTVLAGVSLMPSATGNSAGGSDRIVTSDTAGSKEAITYQNVTVTDSNSAVTLVAEKASSSVVGIKVTIAAQQGNYFFNMGQGESSTGEGSGIILSDDGYILTNNHVIEGALTTNTNTLGKGSKIEVILPSQTDKMYSATLVGRDSETDLAVIKIDATGLTEAELGDSDALKTGELAVAIGNPGGLDYMGSVTAGVISGLDRTLTTSNGTIMKLIQTDAAINPGNSGGALCNADGQIIGINTVKIAATGYEGLGFAIPINDAKAIAEDLINYNYVKGRPSLGISIESRYTEAVAEWNNLPFGILVSNVTESGPAQKAGIKSGDIITEFDGKTIKSLTELETQKDTHKPGDKVNVKVYREGQTLTLTLTLGEETYNQ